MRYLIRMEPGVQPPDETLRAASGSCRDSAWLLVQLLRHMGLAARLVSGCLIQLVPDVKALDGPGGTAVDFTDLHAWCEVYLPGALDRPRSHLRPARRREAHPAGLHAAAFQGRAIEGRVDEAGVEFRHDMHVTRIWESPRVTRPCAENSGAKCSRWETRSTASRMPATCG